MADIRNLPEVEQRVETGPVQFGDDWPGVFIRGDDAAWYVGVLTRAAKSITDPFARLMVSALRDELSGCDLTMRASESRTPE